MSLQTRNTLLACLALVLVVGLAYLPGLSGGFLFDDYPNILQEDRVHAVRLDTESLSRAATAYSGSRPLATTSFAVNHYFSGLDPFGYKLTNLAIHAVNALLVFFLACQLLSISGGNAIARIAAPFAIALIWAAHPLQVSTVLYVVQRMEMIAYTFVILALLAYLRGRERQIEGGRGWHWLVASAALATLGLSGKETALLFPAYALAIELTLFGFKAHSAGTERFIRWSYAVGVVLTLFAFLFLVLPRYTPEEVYAIRDFTLGERLLTQLRVLPMYLGWILLPQPGNYHFYYDSFLPSRSLLDPATTLFGAILIASLLAFALALRKRYPLTCLGILWFFVSHLLTSNVVPVELAFEHRNYFGVLAVILAIADLIRRIPIGEIPRVRSATIGVIVLGVLVLTLIRSAGWGNPLLLAFELAEKSPNSSRASTDLGEQYMIRAGKDPTSKFYAMAQQEFERGSRIPNSSPLPEQGLIILAATAGQPVDPAWWDSMIHKLQSRAVGPQEVTTITGLLRMRGRGLALDDLRFAEAYLVLVNKLRMPASQYFAFGMHALNDVKDPKLAEKLFIRAADVGRDNPEYVERMIKALVERNHLPQAIVMAEYARKEGIISKDVLHQNASPNEGSEGETEP